MEHNHIIINSLGKVERRGAALSKYAMLGALLSNSNKSALAAAMAAPIRRQLDYQGIARRCFSATTMPTGAQIIYDKDPDVAECITEKPESYDHDTIVITSRKRIGQRETLRGVFGKRVTVPEFEIVSNPTVRISDIKSRRFSMIDRFEINPHESIIITSRGRVGRKDSVRKLSFMDKAVQKARYEIMAQEDAAIFKALDDAVAVGIK